MIFNVTYNHSAKQIIIAIIPNNTNFNNNNQYTKKLKTYDSSCLWMSMCVGGWDMNPHGSTNSF